MSRVRFDLPRVLFEGEGGGGGGGNTPPAPAAPPPTAPPASGNQPPPAPATPPSFEDWLKDPVNAGFTKQLRDEAASYRTKFRDAENATKTQLGKLAEALGLKPEEGAQPDPVKAVEGVLSRIRDREIKAAITETTSRLGAKKDLVEAVLRTNGALAELDTDAEDFQAKLDEAVGKVLTAHPELKVAAANGKQVAPSKGGREIRGPGDNAKPQLTREDLQGMTSEQIVAAKEAGQLDALMGRQ